MTVISVENLSKQYRLGLIGGATFREEFDRWWAKKLGKPDPYAKIGQTDHGNRKGEYIWALRDVSFEVKEGEILGIIGRNGAGKSTLLKILSRIVAPTSGCIKIKGRMASLLEVGTGFHPELTGRENIYLNGAILGMTKVEINRKLDEIIDFSEIETYIDTPVKRYSSGMTVRLAFAVAAHLEPEILVMDEVLAVGDAAFQKKCIGKMEDVSRCGRTVLFVSHNMGMIGALCSKVVLLRNGTFALEGAPETVLNEYLDGGFRKDNRCNGSGCSIDYSLIKNQKSEAILVEDVSLEGPDMSNSLIKTGDDVSLKILYKAKSHIKNIAFVVSLKNYIGLEVVRLSTMPISGFQIEKLFDEGVLVLKINKLPLVAGRYHLSLGIVRERLEWLVNLEDLLIFDVHLRDVYGSGFPLDSSHGIIVLDHGWSHYGC